MYAACNALKYLIIILNTIINKLAADNNSNKKSLQLNKVFCDLHMF